MDVLRLALAALDSVRAWLTAPWVLHVHVHHHVDAPELDPDPTVDEDAPLESWHVIPAESLWRLLEEAGCRTANGDRPDEAADGVLLDLTLAHAEREG